MTIRRRLILSYIAMVLVPIILLFTIGTLLAGLIFDVEKQDGQLTDLPDNGKGIQSIWSSFENRDKLLAGVKFIADYDPELLLDEDFQQNTNHAFNRLKSGLVIMKQDTVSYISPYLDDENLSERLKQSELIEDSKWRQRVHNGYTAEHYDFTFADGTPGTLYLLSDLNPFFGKMSRFLPLLFLSLLLVIGLTNGLLTFFVSRSIIKPLYTLKRAAEQIKEGDLDHRIQLTSKDEFAKVGDAFEEMRKRLKQSISMQLQYEENRKELISNISHDLKTPITGIKACLEAIRDGIADTEEKRDKYMRMMDNKTEEMDRMIDELFLFSKLDLKRLPFHYESTDIVGYINDCVEELRTDPRLQNVTIELLSDIAGPLSITIDSEKIHRVIMNIIDNSLSYMDKPEKSIVIGLDEIEGAVAIRINDNGPGIDPEALPHIFERFYRAEPSRNTLTGGSGLGLAIVKHIVEEHGGNVSADSEPGAGTTIVFTLPIRDNLRTGGEKP